MSRFALSVLVGASLISTSAFSMNHEEFEKEKSHTVATECLEDTHQRRVKTFSSQVIILDQEKPFAFFDLPISEEEWDFMQNIKTRNETPTENPNYVQPLVRRLDESLEKNLSAKVAAVCISNDKEREIICNIIGKIIREIVGHFKTNGYHISFRIGGADVYLWHIDRIEHDRDNPRVGIALKGPQTAFYPFSSRVSRDQFKSDASGNFYKRKMDTDSSLIQHAKVREGAVFLKGLEKGALHSVPVLEKNTDRLFIQIEPVEL